MIRMTVRRCSLVALIGFASAAGALGADEPLEVQVIKERHPDGAVAVERHTVQDQDGNFVNHGAWTAYYPDGKKIGEGNYVMGKREGLWWRWFADYDRDSLFSQPLYREYGGPFKSQALFKAGEIDGPWSIFDRNKQRISEWRFVNGVPHGVWTWYYPSGQKRREAHFVKGVLHGSVQEWAPNGQVEAVVEYIEGWKKEQVVKYYRPGLKVWEGWYLRAKEVTRTSYEWWLGEAETKVVSVDGEDIRTGKWTWWFRNGQKQVEGVYAGGKPDLAWTWWHPNGQRWIVGSYVLGKKSGVWKHWSPEGRLEKTEEFPELKRPAPAPVNEPPVVSQQGTGAAIAAPRVAANDQDAKDSGKKAGNVASKTGTVPAPVAPPRRDDE